MKQAFPQRFFGIEALLGDQLLTLSNWTDGFNIHRDGLACVWSQDGPDADLTLYVDQYDPVGLAEAVALGAPCNSPDIPVPARMLTVKQLYQSRDGFRPLSSFELF